MNSISNDGCILKANGTLPCDARGAADYYLRNGRLPLPIPRRDRAKAPSIAGWQNLRPTLQQLDQLFPAGQSLNLGLLLGEPSGGLVDIDLDTPETVAAAAVLLPATGWISGRQGSPRSHWWYVVDAPPARAADEFRDVDSARTMLLELRSTGGQTIVPPGIHESGEAITWYSFAEPARVEIRTLVEAVRSVAAVALLARHWPGKSCRQAAFLDLAGGLLRAGWNAERTERFITALAIVTQDEERRKRVDVVRQTAQKLEQEKKTTGWPKLEGLLGNSGKEVVRTVRQWLGIDAEAAPAKKKRIRNIQPYQPFPIEALPGPVGAYVRQAAAALVCDPAYVALPVLAVLASAIGDSRVLRLKEGWEEPSVLWSVLSADSGTLKTPAFRKAVHYLTRMQKRMLQEYREAKNEYKRELAELKKRAREGEDAADGVLPKEPVLRRILCSDITVEKLAEILEDNPRGVLLARDELNAWLKSFTRYKQTSSDLPNWLEMHRAGPMIVDRKTGERRHLFVERAPVSITGGIQPNVFAKALTPEFLDSGLGARLLMAMPPKRAKRWTEAYVEPEVEQGYHDLLDKLLQLEFDNRDGEEVPHSLKLSRDAKAAWIQFFDEWAEEQAALEGDVAAAFSKLEGAAARFALIHHVVTLCWLETDDRREVGVKSIEAGVALCRWFAYEAQRIYGMLAESPEECSMRKLIDFIRTRDGQISIRDLQKSNSRKYPHAEDAEAALEGLKEQGCGEWRECSVRDQGGRPSRVFHLLPTSDNTDKTPDTGDHGGPSSTCAVSDKTPSDGSIAQPKPHFSNVSEGFVGIVGCRNDNSTPHNGDEARTPHPRVLSDARAVLSDSEDVLSDSAMSNPGSSAPSFLLIHDPSQLATVRQALSDCDRVGLDLETTGLDPQRDRVRLLSLALDTIDSSRFCYLIDCFAVDPRPLWDHLADKELILHNAAFDLAFLARLGFQPAGTVHDTMLLAQLLSAGTDDRNGLAACCERWLGSAIDKSEQKSDWSGSLSETQLLYAARDADVLMPLFQVLRDEIKEARLDRAATLEQRCQPAINWMGYHGVALDRDAWKTLADVAVVEAQRLRQELNEAVAPKPEAKLFPEGWNWDSPQQIKQALALAGCQLDDTADETLAAIDHPIVRLLRRYRLARKRGNTYGIDWLSHVRDDGRVYPHWRQIGASSGRMSCSEPNMQQLPRGDYRNCVVAPPGRILIKADYSQIELRIAAKVSGDQALLEAYQHGEDLHLRTARTVLGISEVSKEHRQLAKALNFGLLYGMGVDGFRDYAKSQYAVQLSEEQARQYRQAFFKSYPGLAAWHRRIGQTRNQAIETRTLTGRRRSNVHRFTEKLNTPVQGSGADGIKLALALLWERRSEMPGTFPVLVVHDEIVIECAADDAAAAAHWLKSAMIDAMAPLLEPVPVEVEVRVARSWAG